MEVFLAAFMPLFIAIDAPGILPTFLSVTADASTRQRRRVVNQAAVTAFGISVFFIFLGKIIFKFLGISVADFKIAGGSLLLVFSVYDVLFETGQRRKAGDENDTLGVVPIGTPLIIGPAALTTLLLIVDSVGYFWTMVSLTLNIIIVWVFFFFSDTIIKVITRPGAIAIGKIFAIFLAAIAVMLIRSGVMELMAMK